MTLLRLLESVHGHLGVLTAVALVHPAILLRRGLPLSRGARWSVWLTTLLAVTHDHELLPRFDRVQDFADFRGASS